MAHYPLIPQHTAKEIRERLEKSTEGEYQTQKA
jgi:hypothetical protein